MERHFAYHGDHLKMKLLLWCLPFSCALLFAQSQPGKMILVDRAIRSAAIPLGNTQSLGFLGDHFRVGTAGEVWILDTIRTWVRPASHAASFGDAFESLTLFGGIEATPPQPGQPPQPECDCHNLMSIKSGIYQPGAQQSQATDVHISSAGSDGIRQVDFQNLSWSVPGGVDIQFGVMGAAHDRKQTLDSLTSNTAELHQLKLFDEKGKLDGPFAPNGKTVDSHLALNIQVWGHRYAPIIIRPTSTAIEVVLRSDTSVDVSKVDVKTLRFGPAEAAGTSRLQTIDGHAALVTGFQWTDVAARPFNLSVCLNGRFQDGVPFGGCSLLTRPK
jgi:hypothetical protein